MAPRAAKPEPLLLKPSTVATMLSVSPKVVRRMLAAGELPSMRLGGKLFVPRAAFESFLQQLPGVSTAEALRNLGKRALVAGIRPEMVEVDDQERR
jgi:excisionase family DNA binding protein